uniref:RNA-directed DNA polymerase n=1 Tax=Trichuris muris TaxID=70415 RepID=A0A5S6QK16_TRIMR
MVKTRGSKSKLLENEPEAEDVVADDVKESVNQGTVRRNETSGWEGRGGPWCQPPGKLSSSMDVELWLGRVDDFLTANAIPEERWVPILKSLVDDKIYRSLRSFGPNCSYEQLTTHLSRRFGREDSLFIRQLQFTQRVQKQGESMEDFADELQCVGSELKKSDDDLLSQFVIGLRDSSVQRHLVERRPLSFEEAVLLAKQFSTLQMSVGKLKKGPVRMTSNVIETLVNDGNGFDDTDGQQFMTVLGQMEKRLSQLETSRNEEKQRELESVQGHSVPSRNVPRNKTNATCFVCGSTGHFSRDCQQRRSQHKVKFSGNPTETTMLFDRRSTEVQRPTLPMVSLRIGDGNVVRALVDTGAYTSIIRKDLVRHLKIQVQPWKRGNFSSVNGQRVIPIGHATFKIECLGADMILHAAVLKSTPFPMVLGVSAMKKLRLYLCFSEKEIHVNRQQTKQTPNAESDSVRRSVAYESEKSDKSVEEKVDSSIHVAWGPRLAASEEEELRQIMCTYGGVFEDRKYPAGCTAQIEHHIVISPTPPISRKAYRMSTREREYVIRQVEEMLEHDIIEPSESPWSSPVVLVRKRNGDWRFCVDYRPLNAVTVKDAYPCPRIEDVLEQLSGCSYFSKLDMKSAYWQVHVHSADRPKTAFVTPDGLYQFKRMPFGLTNAPATFSRLIDCVLGKQKRSHCMAYLDDVIVFSKSFKKHVEHIRSVLQAVRENGLRLNPVKCILATHEIECLGHIVDVNGIRTHPNRVKAMVDYPVPHDTKELRRFLGMCGYYRRFINKFASIARPLTNLLKKEVQWHWDVGKEEAFSQLKKALTASPILRHFDEKLLTEIRTDASQLGLGAVLLQRGLLGEQVVAYISRTLSAAEQRYHSNELECLAVVWALHQFRYYVHGRKFTVVTDNTAVKWLFTSKKSTGKIARWVLAAMEFLDDCTFIHRAGKCNELADALSRTASQVGENSENLMERMLCMAAPEAISNEEFRILQLRDPFTARLLGILEGRDAVAGSEHMKRIYQIHNGVLYQKNQGRGRPWLLIIPQKLGYSICVATHASKTGGHFGMLKTMEKLKQRYTWPGMRKMCRQVVKSCPTCQSRKIPQCKPSGLLKSIAPPEKPFEMIGLDHLGPFPKSRKNNRYIIVCVDYLTKWVEAETVPDTSTEKVAMFLLNNVILRHGTPNKMITDRGTAFTSGRMVEVLEALGIQHGMTTAYHPQTNGLVERANRTLTGILAAYVDASHQKWDELVPFATFAMNTSEQESTKWSPFELVYGRLPILPEESRLPWPVDSSETFQKFRERVKQWRTQAKNTICKSQRKQKRYYDNGRKPNVLFKPGQLVMVRRHLRKVGRSAKLLPRYDGPFQIVENLSELNYRVAAVSSDRRRRSNRQFTVHATQLKPFYVAQKPDIATLGTSAQFGGGGCNGRN